MTKNLIRKMCKTAVLGMAAGTMLTSSMLVQAAPKEMKDGTVFDAEYYAQKYADVTAVYGTEEEALFKHYTDFGRAENREAVEAPGLSTFDPVYYAQQNPDVVAVYGTGSNNLYQHYLQYGMKEGRKPTAGSSSETDAAAKTSNQQTAIPEAAAPEQSASSAQADSITDEEAEQIFRDYAGNIHTRVPESVCAFFDTDGNMTIDQNEWVCLLAWAVDNYNTVDKGAITQDEMIVIGRAMHDGTFKLPDSCYYVE